LSAGIDSAGNAARIASDGWGNVVVVSGPSGGRDLAVTSYTAGGVFRWRRTVSPASGTFAGTWVAAAPNGDIVATGHNLDSHGRPITATMVRYTTDGTFLWRVDFSAPFFPTVGRLVVDSAGNAYVTWSATGSGIFVQKYSPTGALEWSQQDLTGSGYGIATSLALSPDGADVVATGNVPGGATWITAAYDTATGVRRWHVAAGEGTALRDVVTDVSRVYVTGLGAVSGGTPSYFLTVVAYDRATGARLWRTDKRPADSTGAAGLRIAMAPDGSLVATGQAIRGFLDWYTVSLETSGTVRWEAVRDGGLNTNEVPQSVLVLMDGTTVVTGPGGPNLPGGYIQGVTAGYNPSGQLMWEAYSKMATVWATGLPNGDVCAAGGYDALVTCWRASGVVRAVMSASPASGVAPLSVTFDGSGSTSPNGAVSSWEWSFGDGTTGAGAVTTHVYTSPGTYTASLTVRDGTGATGVATGTVVVTPLPPAAPTGLSASQSGTLVLLAWQDNSANETRFDIERCEGAGCANFASYASQWANVASYSDYAAIAGRSYSYRVRAYNTGGYSGYSNIASIQVGSGNEAPTAPANLTAGATGRAKIGLAWTNTATNATSISVERCAGSGCAGFAVVAQLEAAAKSWTDTGLKSGTTYRYRVRAANSAGSSAYSNIAGATARSGPRGVRRGVSRSRPCRRRRVSGFRCRRRVPGRSAGS
jgi:PKD repeat protein